MILMHAIIALLLVKSSLYGQETSEKQLLQNQDLFFEEKNRVETRGFADPQLPPAGKPKSSVGGGEAEVVLKKKKKKGKKGKDSDVEYDDFQMDTVQTREDPRGSKRKPSPPKKVTGNVSAKDFVVKTYKVAAPVQERSIQLVFPPHNSTLSSGVINFEWDSDGALARKKMDLIVERLSSRERYVHRSGKMSKKVYFGPGEYRWQVSCPSQSEESRWRIFRVVDMKSARGR